MLCRNTARQSKTVHQCPALAWKRCGVPGLAGVGVSPRDCTSLISPGGCCVPGEGVLVPAVLSWGKPLGLLLCPLNLRMTETCINHFSAVWLVCQGKTHLLSQELVKWQEPTGAFSAEQLSFARTGWSSAAGLEPGPTVGAVNGVIKAFNLTPYQQLCWLVLELSDVTVTPLPFKAKLAAAVIP